MILPPPLLSDIPDVKRTRTFRSWTEGMLLTVQLGHGLFYFVSLVLLANLKLLHSQVFRLKVRSMALTRAK